MTATLPSLGSLLSSWRADPIIRSSIAAWRTIPARPAHMVPFPDELHPALVDALETRDIRALYSHQDIAWAHVQAGRHIVVVTGTASGKTLCYNLPVLDRLLRDARARALYLYPTKALAQDQAAALAEMKLAPQVATFDGDTPADARPALRSRARIVITNPDMVHVGILPHHTLWADFFKHLQFVVVDEMHAYRGVFGSHVANVLRRLKRVARFYGSTPQFILTSATIANPAALAERLIEEPVTLVDEDGSARGEKNFIIYNPPVVDQALGIRRSALLESVRLAKGLLNHNIQAIVFARSRRAVELVLKYLSSPDSSERDEARRAAALLPRGAIRGYRSGYLQSQRREIERGLRNGSVRAVVATNALELGIDVGGMGAAVLVGYPGTIAGTWQQAGRAGRGAGHALAVLVASADPLDQFLARHPEYLWERTPEHAFVNADHLLILLQHLRCAAFELPFREGDAFGRVDSARLTEFLEFLQESQILHKSGDKYFWMADQYPAEAVSLRSASAATVVLQADGQTIGKVDLESAYWMVHPEAIYLHEGQAYYVDELNLAGQIAHMHAVEVDYYTEPRSETTVALLDELARAEVPGALKAHGEISVTRQITGYKKLRWYSQENLGEGLVLLPPTELHTTGYWIALKDETVESLRAQGLWTNDPNDYGPNWQAQRERTRARDGYRCQGCGAPEQGREHHVHHKIPFRGFPSFELANHIDNLVTLCPNCHRRAEMAVRLRSGLSGLGYVLGHLAPLFLMCDTHDIGIASDPASPLAYGRPAVVIYDQIPAGIGFSERLFELHGELLTRALDLVAACECADGCPSCVGPGGEMGCGGKKETRALLEMLVARGGMV